MLAVLTLGSCRYAAYQEQPRTPHTLYLYVRYNSRYAYTTLPLTVELRSALGWSATTTLALPLTEGPGIWSGKGYALRQQLYKVNASLTPPHPGLYTIVLRQATGQTTLAGVETIGVAWVAADR